MRGHLCFYLFAAGPWSAWSWWNWLITTWRTSSLWPAWTSQVQPHLLSDSSETSLVFSPCRRFSASLFYAPPLACPLCPRPARHLPPGQRRAEDPGELGAAPARADEQIWRPASQLHQHFPHRPERRRRPGYTATQGHAGARQHTLQVGHLLPPTDSSRLRVFIREEYPLFCSFTLYILGASES